MPPAIPNSWQDAVDRFAVSLGWGLRMKKKFAAMRLTLDAVVTYEIRVSGAIEGDWPDWIDGTLKIDSADGTSPVSVIAAKLDQSALHGMLRRLYSLGFPLLSVKCVFEESL